MIFVRIDKKCIEIFESIVKIGENQKSGKSKIRIFFGWLLIRSNNRVFKNGQTNENGKIREKDLEEKQDLNA